MRIDAVMRRKSRCLLTVTVLLAPASGLTENLLGTEQQLGEIIVTSTPIENEQARLPFAVGTVGEESIQLGRQQLGLDESLVTIWGGRRRGY